VAPIVVDLRNVYRAEEMARQGFDYVRVGAKPNPRSSKGDRRTYQPGQGEEAGQQPATNHGS